MQFGQRVALIEIVLKQCGHSFVVGSAGRGSFLHAVCGSYNQEDDKGNDEEVNGGLYEGAPFDNSRSNGDG